jgi:hypothetical protein
MSLALFNLLGGKGVGGFNMDSVYSAGVVAAGGAIVTLAAVITSFYVAACCETRRAGLIPPGPTVSVSVPRAT